MQKTVSCCGVSDVGDDFTGIVFDHLFHGPNGCVESGDLSHKGPQLGLVKNAWLKTKTKHIFQVISSIMKGFPQLMRVPNPFL